MTFSQFGITESQKDELLYNLKQCWELNHILTFKCHYRRKFENDIKCSINRPYRNLAFTPRPSCIESSKFLWVRRLAPEQLPRGGRVIHPGIGLLNPRGWTTAFGSPAVSAPWTGLFAFVAYSALDRLLYDAKRRRFDAVLVYRYDHFARSLRQLVNALTEFDALGIHFVSLHEGVDTSTPNGRLVFGIFASIAEFERELIRSRVRSGLASARAKGKRLGRPKVVVDSAGVVELRRAGCSWGNHATNGLDERDGPEVGSGRKRVSWVAQKPLATAGRRN